MSGVMTYELTCVIAADLAMLGTRTQAFDRGFNVISDSSRGGHYRVTGLPFFNKRAIVLERSPSIGGSLVVLLELAVLRQDSVAFGEASRKRRHPSTE